MKFQFKSIEKKQNSYKYIFVSLYKKNKINFFYYFSIASILGSYSIFTESGLKGLIIFWIFIFLLTILTKKYVSRSISKDVFFELEFYSVYPHYTARDIILMLNETGKIKELKRQISKNEISFININIGELKINKVPKVVFSKELLDLAIDNQLELEEQWSIENGGKRPDLNLPKM